MKDKNNVTKKSVHKKNEKKSWDIMVTTKLRIISKTSRENETEKLAEERKIRKLYSGWR